MNWFRKNTALVAAVLSLLIIFVSFAGITGAENGGSMFLRDMDGDRRVLEDVDISGVLQDRYHGQQFSIDGGRLSRNFKFYDSRSDMTETAQKSSGNTKSIEGVQYYQTIGSRPSQDASIDIVSKPWYPEEHTQGNTGTVQSDAILYTEETSRVDKIDVLISMGKQKKDGMNETVRVNTGIKVESKVKEFQFNKIYFTDKREDPPVERLTSESYEGRIFTGENSSNAFTYINGKMYFTVLTDKTATGENGIFRIDEWVAWPNTDEAETYGKVNKICGFGLDNHDTEVLGLENVDNKLVLYMLVDNMPTFRAYEPDTGKLIDELKVDGLRVDSENRYYQAFGEGNNITVWFGGERGKLVNVKLDGKLSVEHIVNSIYLLDANEEAKAPDNVETANGKLFLLTYANDASDTATSIDILKRRHFMILVYGKSDFSSKLLYRGEIVSDANQDTEYDKKDISPGFGGVSQENYRHFAAVKVESR